MPTVLAMATAQSAGASIVQVGLVGTYVASDARFGDAVGELRLELAADGVAQLVVETDAPAPVVRLGTWRDYSDGTLTVVFDKSVGGPAAAPTVTLLLAQRDGALEVTQGDAAGEGGAPLLLTLESAPEPAP